jgi:predicted hydrocarbon binding protein
MALDLEFSFDEQTYRKRVNGFDIVGHSHNLMGIVIKIAEKFDEFGGTRILAESAEDAFRPIFDDYVKRHDLPAGEERLAMAADFYETLGMGLMKSSGAEGGGEVNLTRSHVDEGWKMKFGDADHPLNYFTRGFIAAMFGCAFDKPARSYQVEETASMAKGDEQGSFSVKAA